MNAYRPIITLAFCFLAACAPLRKPMETPLSPQYPTTAAIPSSEATGKMDHVGKTPTSSHAVSSWDLSGAIAARNKNKSWTASINWRQQGPNHYQIRLFGPLGGGTVIIEKQGNVITYRDGPKKIASTDADKLLLAQTGVQLPVANLYYWVQGIPAPGSAGSEKQGKVLSQLHQDGYTVTYSEYTTTNGITLPSKMRLEGHGVLIKLVIKHWKI